MVGYLRLPYLRGISASFHFIITRISVPDRRIIAENSLFDVYKGLCALNFFNLFYMTCPTQQEKKSYECRLKKTSPTPMQMALTKLSTMPYSRHKSTPQLPSMPLVHQIKPYKGAGFKVPVSFHDRQMCYFPFL